MKLSDLIKEKLRVRGLYSVHDMQAQSLRNIKADIASIHNVAAMGVLQDEINKINQKIVEICKKNKRKFLSMKNLLFNLFLVLSLQFGSNAIISQEATNISTEVSPKVLQVQVPDSLCVTINDERVCFPTKDVKETEELISQFIKENEGSWPTSLAGWLILILGTIVGGRYAAVWSNATKVFYFLKGFLKETLHVVAFVSGLIAVGLTFLIGVFTKELFAWDIFGMVWPWTALVSIYVYEKWLKKPKKDDSIPAVG